MAWGSRTRRPMWPVPRSAPVSWSAWAILLLIAALPETGVAQSPAGRPSVSPREAQCGSDEFIRKCPQTCRKVCGEREFQRQHRQACIEPLTNPAAADNAQFCTAAAAASASFAKCLADAKGGKSDRERLKERRIPERMRQVLDKLLDKLPACTPGVSALVETFDCLKNEGVVLEEGFKTLEGKGYGGKLDRTALCSMSEAEIDSDSNEVEGMEKRTGVLRTNFDETSACKREVGGWLDSLSDAKSELGRDANDLITWFKEDLKDADAMEATVGKLAGQLTDQFSKMQGTVLKVLAGCRRQNKRQ